MQCLTFNLFASGHTLLEACRQGDPQKVKKAYAPEIVNFRHPFSQDTPLHCAAGSPFPKRKSVVETLCRKGANLNDKNKEFLTPLHVAAEKSHYDVSGIVRLNVELLRKYRLGTVRYSF